MIYRGNDQVLEVDLRSLLRSGSAMADIRLRRNDIVFIPSQADQFVTVLGEVEDPGRYSAHAGIHIALRAGSGRGIG